MPWSVTIEIKQEPDPTLSDLLFGTLWYWCAWDRDGLYRKAIKSGWASTEKQARRRAERAVEKANRIRRYEYTPEGFTPGETGK